MLNMQIGEWYRSVKNTKCECVGILKGNLQAYVIVEYSKKYYPKTHYVESTGHIYGQDNPYLVAHIPECTGPDYVEPQYRLAVPKDAVDQKACRITQPSGKVVFGVLQGFYRSRKDAYCKYFVSFGKDIIDQWVPENTCKIEVEKE